MSTNASWAKMSHMFMQNDMNRLIRILIIAVSAIAVACSGNVDTSSLPVLTASDTEIDLATETSATFTVTYDGRDVTAESEIFSTLSTLEFDGSVYTPVNTGGALFTAVYNGMESNSVTVNVINSKPQVESIYDKHVCVMEFTGASCAFCPAGYDNMMLQLSKPGFAKYKDNIHICAFHSEEMGTDTLAIPATMDVKGMFAGLDLPSYAIDMRDAGGLNSDGMAGFNSALKASLEEYTPHCGVAVSSEVSAGKAEVEVKVTSEFTTEYRVVVLVVQDGIVGYQKHGTYGDLDAYTHKHVVRKVVTEYTRTFTGERITDDGRIAAGEEKAGTWTFDVDARWNLENTEIYAIVLDSEGHVNNMNVCAIDGGNSEYDIK